MLSDPIRASAELAAAQGRTPNDACPEPFFSANGLHWVACYLCAGLTYDHLLQSGIAQNVNNDYD